MPALPRAQKAREYLDQLIPTRTSGSVLLTENIASSLSTKCRSVHSKTVGLAMRERDDVELISMGRWRVK